MENQQAESRIHTHWAKGDFHACAVAVLECYGTELYSFLVGRFPSRGALADDAFSEFSEDLWRGLPGFQWRCAMRSWCYKLARSAAGRVGRAIHNTPRRRVSLSSSSGLLESALDRARFSTAPYLQSEVKDEFAKLRETLSEDDRDLLTLRVDRKLAWREIAYALTTDDRELEGENARRVEAALRQRFADVKKRIRRAAIEAGLL